MYTHFLGVDISKDTLDIAVVSPANGLLYERQIANKKAAIVAFVSSAQFVRLANSFERLQSTN